jgi:hypothetical protein
LNGEENKDQAPKGNYSPEEVNENASQEQAIQQLQNHLKQWKYIIIPTCIINQKNGKNISGNF